MYTYLSIYAYFYAIYAISLIGFRVNYALFIYTQYIHTIAEIILLATRVCWFEYI